MQIRTNRKVWSNPKGLSFLWSHPLPITLSCTNVYMLLTHIRCTAFVCYQWSLQNHVCWYQSLRFLCRSVEHVDLNRLLAFSLAQWTSRSCVWLNKRVLCWLQLLSHIDAPVVYITVAEVPYYQKHFYVRQPSFASSPKFWLAEEKQNGSKNQTKDCKTIHNKNGIDVRNRWLPAIWGFPLVFLQWMKPCDFKLAYSWSLPRPIVKSGPEENVRMAV